MDRIPVPAPPPRRRRRRTRRGRRSRRFQRRGSTPRRSCSAAKKKWEETFYGLSRLPGSTGWQFNRLFGTSFGMNFGKTEFIFWERQLYNLTFLTLFIMILHREFGTLFGTWLNRGPGRHLNEREGLNLRTTHSVKSEIESEILWKQPVKTKLNHVLGPVNLSLNS